MKSGKYHEGLQRSLKQCQKQWRRSPFYTQKPSGGFKSVSRARQVVIPCTQKRKSTLFVYNDLGVNSHYELESAEILLSIKKS